MNTATSIRASTLRVSLTACAVAALAGISSLACASVDEDIVVSAPAAKTVGRDAATGAPIKELTAIAQVPVDPATLTTHSGAALLKTRVAQAARESCAALDPFTFDDGACVRGAVASAKPQVHAAIVQARDSANG